jgi:ubiquinone/menaquinone biosynthesis C-methylase UbiE
MRWSLPRPKRGASRSNGAVEALRDSWSQYPGDWARDAGLRMGFETLGEEWGGPEFADHIVGLVSDYLGDQVDVLELGCGGGKFSRRIAPRCRSLLCTDISAAMIEHTRAGLADDGLDANVSYKVLNGRDFEGIPDESVDFIFSYDVFIHLQPQNVYGYLRDARRVLRPNGAIMLHQVNLATAGGFRHFWFQYSQATWERDFGDPRRRGHIYFMSEDQMRMLADESSLATDRIVSDHGEFERVTAGRDLIGFFSKRPSRLDSASRDDVDLIQPDGSDAVYAVIGGVRYGFNSASQFERDGFDWERIRQVQAPELATLEDGGELEPWE